ncbi:DUF6965 family protein [Pedobacter metabolipauper]|uniref:DUF6965 family protein n=1 Tax=Pedobacter metabolipauper TaxID=425513 RepID=UPI00105CCCE1|nr:hypothetical protein [Pedobacter metabolipauper]
MTAEEFEAYFQGITLPEPPIYLHESIVIRDVEKFLERQITILKRQPDARTSIPAHDRLMQFIEIIENKEATS